MVPKTREFILLQIPCEAEQKLGLLVTTPTGRQYTVLPNDPSDQLNSAATGLICRLGQSPAKPKPRNILYVEIREPAVGVWRFQPYFADWAPGGVDVAHVGNVQIWTSSGPLVSKEAAVPLPARESTLKATGHRDPQQRFEVEIAK